MVILNTPEGQKMEATRATKAVVGVMCSCVDIASGLKKIAAECVRDALAKRDEGRTQWKACAAFGEKARDFILEKLRETHLPLRLEDLAGHYLNADYDQIFAILTTSVEVELEMGIMKDDYAHLRSVIAGRKPEPVEPYNDWPNYATWLANIHLDAEGQDEVTMALNDISRASYGPMEMDTHALVFRCAGNFRDIVRRLAVYRFGESDSPSDLIGRFMDVDPYSLSICRIEDNIRKVNITESGGRHRSFFLRDGDRMDLELETGLTKIYGSNIEIDADGDRGKVFKADTDQQVLSYEIVPLSIKRLSIFLNSGEKYDMFVNEGDDPDEAITSNIVMARYARRVEEEDGMHVLLTEKGDKILSWKFAGETEEKHSPAMGM